LKITNEEFKDQDKSHKRSKQIMIKTSIGFCSEKTMLHTVTVQQIHVFAKLM